jgi:hypothetical protein
MNNERLVCNGGKKSPNAAKQYIVYARTGRIKTLAQIIPTNVTEKRSPGLVWHATLTATTRPIYPIPAYTTYGEHRLQ